MNVRKIVYETPEKKGMPVAELERLLSEWQKKLKMQDWKLDLKIVDFQNSNGYRQSGDFVADVPNKTATILMTWDPWRGDEEYTLVHEMLHTLVYDFDSYCENTPSDAEIYMDKLEKLVHHLTRMVLGRSDR